MSYDVIVIFGNPDKYVSVDLKVVKKFDIYVRDGIYPAAMMVKELTQGCLEKRKWRYVESEVYDVDVKSGRAVRYEF